MKTACAHSERLLKHKDQDRSCSFFFLKCLDEVLLFVSFGCQMLIIKTNSVIRVKYYLRSFFLSQWLLEEEARVELAKNDAFMEGGLFFVSRDLSLSSLTPQRVSNIVQ